MSSVKQQEQSSLDQTQQQESETPQAKPSTTDRVVDSEYHRWLLPSSALANLICVSF
jgi:hypothetical protein